MNLIEPLKQLAPTVLIAMFTIHSNDTFRKCGLGLGVEWYCFSKCTDSDALLKVVREHAARNRINHANQGTADE